MQQQQQNDAGVELPGLEYDVPGLGATEASPSEENQPSWLLVHYMAPAA